MAGEMYKIPSGVHQIPKERLDLRPDPEVDHDLLNPSPVSSAKNVWFYWHQGFVNAPGYTKRIIRRWHRRFSKAGWTVRVLDRVPGSPLNVENYLDVKDPNTFPQAFIDGRIGGDYGVQHNSDLTRFPLLLKYGGVYADVSFIQIGDLNALWEKTVGDPSSPWEVLSYNTDRWLTNYFMGTRKGNPFFERCHKLLLALWNADGGKVDTTGMHASPLLRGCPLLEGPPYEDNGRKYTKEEASATLSDYIIQGQAVTMVMGLVDEEGGWNGPQYCAEHLYALEFMVGSQLINELTAWDGNRAYELMSLSLPKSGEAETDDQGKARDIVEQCLSRSFGFKLAHGIILKMIGPTLGSNWRDHPGSDDVPGTYAHWFRYGTLYWCQDQLPDRLNLKPLVPLRSGALLKV